MDKKLPGFLQNVIKKYPQVWESYGNFGQVIRSISGLDERCQRLAKLGIAVGSGREGAVHSHTRRCKEAGIKDEEIYHTALLAITSVGWSQAMAALSWIDDVLGGLSKTDE